MKSDTYQKEGWFVLDDKNRVFGVSAEDSDDLDLNNDFDFYHKNKEEAKKNIDKAAKDFSDFMDSFSQDVEGLSEDDINRGIEKILERTHPGEKQPESVKTAENKRVKLKVLFLVALLAIVSFSCFCAVGDSHNISIENGFVSFAKETVQVVFFGEDEEYISVDSLLSNLKEHGYEDILFPEEFVTNSDDYKVSVPEYFEGDIKQVSFDVSNDTSLFSFVIYNYQTQQALDYPNVENAQTVLVDGIYIYMFDLKKDMSTTEFFDDKYRYYIISSVPCLKMEKIVETIK